MANTSQGTSRLAEEFRKMGHDTLLLNSLKLGKLQHRYVVCRTPKSYTPLA